MKVVGIYEDGTVYLDFEGNEGTKRTYKTLKKAKLANEKASVYRCWLLDGEIKGMTVLKAYGTQVCTIMNADKYISDAIKNGK